MSLSASLLSSVRGRDRNVPDVRIESKAPPRPLDPYHRQPFARPSLTTQPVGHFPRKSGTTLERNNLTNLFPKGVPMAAVPQTRYQHLEHRPGSNYKQLWIKGRRIRAIVVDRAVNGVEPCTPEKFAKEYQVPLEAVLETLDYAAHHQDVLQADIAMEEEDMRRRGLDRPMRPGTPRAES